MSFSLSPYAAEETVDTLGDLSTHVALFLADPIAAGNQSSEQPNANGYARAAVTFVGSSGVRASDAAVEFVADGDDWTGPWYIGTVTSGTHGSGQVVGIVVDPDTGEPLTTADIANVEGLNDGETLRIPVGILTWTTSSSSVPVDPVAEILALSPTLFWVFDRASYNSVQLLFQDDGGTTPVTTDGQPVGLALDLVEGRELAQSSSVSRPLFEASGGLIFDGSNDWLVMEDCSDLISPASTVDTETVALSCRDDGPSTGQRMLLNADIPAQMMRCGVQEGYYAQSPGGVGQIGDHAAGAGKHVAYIREMQYGTRGWVSGVGACASNATVARSYAAIAVGRYHQTISSSYWDGRISCLAIWDRQLTLEELGKLQGHLLRIGAQP